MLMLGDTGANPLGAYLGLALALWLPLPAQWAAVAALLALHVYAERGSLTRLIARVRVLAWLDGLGRGEGCA
jgi:UDP-GlcNAc:undecaprenyl-phosphate/decaprenyl-phosphate GlcNAc-1-phosphate transferase